MICGKSCSKVLQTPVSESVTRFHAKRQCHKSISKNSSATVSRTARNLSLFLSRCLLLQMRRFKKELSNAASWVFRGANKIMYAWLIQFDGDGACPPVKRCFKLLEWGCKNSGWASPQVYQALHQPGTNSEDFDHRADTQKRIRKLEITFPASKTSLELPQRTQPALRISLPMKGGRSCFDPRIPSRSNQLKNG
jgi:hypothetical protein